jgi:CRP/FNR family transcriptional regulator, cyclic AMP receptor protein
MADGLNLNEKLLRSYYSKYPVRLIKKGRPLFYQGEIPRTAYFVKSGVVKFYNITSSGEEKIVGYEGNDGLLPNEWIFNKSPVALYYYDTFTDCEVYSIPRSELIQIINSDKNIAVSLLNRYISMYIGSTMHLHALEQLKAREKLLHILQYLVLRFGKEESKNCYRIELRLTHQDIANLVGLTRETVSTEISKLRKDKILTIKDLHYVVDTDKALRILGESDFNDLVL